MNNSPCNDENRYHNFAVFSINFAKLLLKGKMPVIGSDTNSLCVIAENVHDCFRI